MAVEAVVVVDWGFSGFGCMGDHREDLGFSGDEKALGEGGSVVL